MRLLADLLPEHFKNIVEVSEIIAALQVETDLLYKERFKILDNQFLEKAENYGIFKLEKIYNLTNNKNLSLEERKFALKTLMLERRPTTLQFLKNQIKILCNSDDFEFDIDYEKFHISVYLDISKSSKIDAVYNLLSVVIPAAFSFEVGLIYNPHEIYEEELHDEMSDYSYGQLREQIFEL